MRVADRSAGGHAEDDCVRGGQASGGAEARLDRQNGRQNDADRLSDQQREGNDPGAHAFMSLVERSGSSRQLGSDPG
jgi:hypothetical protein